MRITSVPDKLKTHWRKLRLLCLAMVAGVSIYVVIMVLMAHNADDGPVSVFEWQGSAAPEDRDVELMLMVILGMFAVVGFFAAFAFRSWLLGRPPSLMSTPPDLLATGVGRAFARYQIATIMGMALAEVGCVCGLVIYIMFGHFLTFTVPAMVLSLAGILTLFPTEMQLLQHLESAEGDSHATDGGA